MKALSLTQPWAWLVVHAGKDIENRRWNTKFRGEFLIHAAKGMKAADYDSAYGLAGRLGVATLSIPRPHKLERGGIVGMARIVDVVTPVEAGGHRWHFPEHFGFVLADVRPIPFIPCKGALGFWDAPEHVMASLHHVWTAERAQEDAAKTRRLGA